MLRKSVIALAVCQLFLFAGASFARDLGSVDPLPAAAQTPAAPVAQSAANSADRTGEIQLAQAQLSDELGIGRSQNREDANAGTVMIMTTRTLGSAFMTAARDLSTLLDSGDQYSDMRIIPVVARGKEQNLWDVLYLKGIDAGFVQTDVLSYLEDDPRINSIRSRLRYICMMFPEDLHLVAREEIRTIQDLEGKKVSINAKGTGSSLLGTLLFKRLGINAKLEHEDTNRAIARMKAGDLDAHINVLAKPTRVLQGIKKEDNLHIVPVPLVAELAELYFPTTFTHEDYPALVPEGVEVPSIAAGNVLAVFNWPEDHPRYKKVERFVNAFFDRFEELKQSGFHPKWKDVNLAAEAPPGWVRFKAAQEWLDRNARKKPLVAGAAGTAQIREEFNAFLAQPGVVSSRAGANDNAALFEEFLKWRSGQRQ